MDPERWDRLQRIFHRAAELGPDERGEYIERACQGDEALAREVRSLLAGSDDDSRVLGAPIGELAGELARAGLGSGHLVGSYRVVRELGRGGMGVVYLAERVDEEFDQLVALKVLSGVVASPGAVHRFLAERRILAQLEHPNIARLLDGGTTHAGAPYFAMEVVEGEPIDRYCDARRSTPRERLRLFLTVCEAVQHAHRRLVVHRDLKPSNILVTADGVPKLLDFGIAKLLDPQREADGLTRRGELPMTPEYASPEQVLGAEVSTSTDVYGLGLLLYEILTGRRAHRLASRSRDDVERVVCRDPATRPSSAVVRAGDGGSADRAIDPEEAAAARGSTPPRLRRHLRGDLDTIVLTALRKEPERRYASVSALAEDVRRHLDGRPVRARGDGLGYRAGKFVRRHALGVGVAAVVALSLLFGSLALWLGLERARQAERRAAAEARTAEEVAGFLAELLGSADPRDSGGEEPTVRELLDRGAERIDALADQPRVRARLLVTMGEAYFSLGRFAAASDLLQRAVAALDPSSPPDRSLLIEAYNLQVPLLTRAGRLDEALATAERAAELGSSLTAEAAFARARSLNALAVALMDGGDLARGRAVNRQVLSLLPGDGGADVRAARAVTLNQLGSADRQLGDLDSAVRHLRTALEVTAGHPALTFQRSLILRDLALVETDLGNPEAARSLLESSLAAAREVYGAGHPALLGPLLLLGDTEVTLGRLDAAEERFAEALRIVDEAIEPETPNHAMALFYHSRLLEARARWDAALAGLGRAIEIGDATMGSDHPNVLRFRVARGRVLAAAGRRAEAREEVAPIAGEVRRRFGGDHQLSRTVQAVLAGSGS